MENDGVDFKPLIGRNKKWWPEMYSCLVASVCAKSPGWGENIFSHRPSSGGWAFP